MNDEIEFLGKGIAFDFGVDSQGGIAFSSFEMCVEESIGIILSTQIGERIYNPDFGCRIHELMFEPNTTQTQALAALYVREALEMYENRINLLDVEAYGEDERSLNVDIRYELIESDREYNLVYPFYLLPV